MRGHFTHTLTANSGVLAHQSTLGQEREMWFTAFPCSQKRGEIRREGTGAHRHLSLAQVLLVTIPCPGVTCFSKAYLQTALVSSTVYT